MIIVIAVLTAFVQLASIDYAWYRLLLHKLYPRVSGMRERIGLVGALSAYLALSVGLSFFATIPAVVGDSVWFAVALGALFGAVVYGVHAGGGYALMRGVRWHTAVLEWIRGTVLTALVCTGSYAILHLFGF